MTRSRAQPASPPFRIAAACGSVTRALACAGMLGLAAAPAAGQIGTIGAGALFSEWPTEPIFYLHGETPPLAEWRGYLTLLWTDESARPTVITIAERPVLRFGNGFTGLGAGLLWPEVTDYDPEPMLVSRTVVPVPIPRTTVVVTGSTLPFQDFDWSVGLVLDVTLVFVR